MKSLAQVLGGNIDIDHLVRHSEHVVGDPLLHFDAGGLLDDIVQTHEVLNVQGRDDVNPCAQHLFNVSITFFVPAAGGVGMSQLIHERNCGVSSQQSIEIEFLEN